MILSRSRNFIFVKTRKTGGTSVEIALSAFCGEEDIVTLITPIDETLRLEKGRAFRNCLSDPALERQYETLLRESDPPVRKIPREVKDAQVFYNHMPLSEILERSGVRGEDFFRFTIERHPYDKAVSYANFHMGYRAYARGGALSVGLEEIPAEIDRLIESGKLSEKIRNHELYCLGGRVGVDRILRYERLGEEFAEMLETIGVPGEVELPSVKVGQRDRSVPARDILTAAQRQWIQEACAPEFELLDYQR